MNNKWFFGGIFLLSSVCSCAPVRAETPAITPFRSTGPLAVRGVGLPAAVRRYSVEEIRVGLSATYDNPFDPGDIAVDARVTAPSGRVDDVPGFLYRPYRRALEAGGKETVTVAGAPEWRVRYAPSEVGRYSMVVTVRDRTGVAVSKRYGFRSAPSASPGFIRLSKRDPHYFAFDSGRCYFPVGANICWAGSRGTYDYDDWIADFTHYGCNYTRVWLSPTWATLSTNSGGSAADGNGYRCIDLGNAWKLDHVLDTAGRHSMYVMLCLDNQGRTSAYHKQLGGPLTDFKDFWTDPEVDYWYRAKLRYLVARYGADTHVFSWELWNEVDLVDHRIDPVRDWHARMGRALKSIDPYKHLVTTSFSRWDGEKEIDTLPEMDFVQTHLYHLGDLASDIVNMQHQKEQYGKAEYTGETGADWKGPSQDDPRGEQIHQSLWASAVAGGSGASAMWWWDNYTAPNRLWPVYKPLATFVADVDFAGEHMRSKAVSFTGNTGDIPNLIGWATAGDHVALAWVRVADASWIDICQAYKPVVPVPGAAVVVEGVAPGRWVAEIWDTWKGRIVRTERVLVGNTHEAVVALPRVDEDFGIKLRRR